MTKFHLVGALALMFTAGAARAQSFIPANQVDDFGPFHYSDPTPNPYRPTITWIVEFEGSTGHPIDLHPSRYVAEQEQVGAAGAEPAIDLKASERAQEKAAENAYARARFLQEVWRSAQ